MGKRQKKSYEWVLQDLIGSLPPHLEGRKRNKIEILLQASKYIKELNNTSDELLNTQSSDPYSKCTPIIKKR